MGADINYPDKDRGCIALHPTDFCFISPGRPGFDTFVLDLYLSVARAVRQSGVANYKQDRIPIKSSLNIQVWQSHLRDYCDQKLVQYLQYGFPLSIKTQTAWFHTKFYCDDLAVVQVVRTGKNKDNMLALCLRNIWLITASYDIDIQIDHIQGCANKIADLLPSYFIHQRQSTSACLKKYINHIHSTKVLFTSLTLTHLYDFRFKSLIIIITATGSLW